MRKRPSYSFTIGRFDGYQDRPADPFYCRLPDYQAGYAAGLRRRWLGHIQDVVSWVLVFGGIVWLFTY